MGEELEREPAGVWVMMSRWIHAGKEVCAYCVIGYCLLALSCVISHFAIKIF